MKPFCNTLEVETLHRQTPPPTSRDGAGYSAACWALAGRIDEARDVILRLAGDDRWKAAGIVFDHAYVLYEPARTQVVFASNPERFVLVP